MHSELKYFFLVISSKFRVVGYVNINQSTKNINLFISLDRSLVTAKTSDNKNL